MTNCQNIFTYPKAAYLYQAVDNWKKKQNKTGKGLKNERKMKTCCVTKWQFKILLVGWVFTKHTGLDKKANRGTLYLQEVRMPSSAVGMPPRGCVCSSWRQTMILWTLIPWDHSRENPCWTGSDSMLVRRSTVSPPPRLPEHTHLINKLATSMLINKIK